MWEDILDDNAEVEHLCEDDWAEAESSQPGDRETGGTRLQRCSDEVFGALLNKSKAAPLHVVIPMTRHFAWVPSLTTFFASTTTSAVGILSHRRSATFRSDHRVVLPVLAYTSWSRKRT